MLEGTEYILQDSHPHVSQKKEIFSRDINLYLNAINYLLCFGSLAKHLTFKGAGADVLPGNKRVSHKMRIKHRR